MWTKQIHFSFGFFDDKMPPAFQKRIDKVKAANPDHDIKIWGPKESRAVMAKHFPWALERYDSFPWAIQRSDMSRYAILYGEGGLYMDLDYKLKQPLSTIYKWLDENQPQGQVFINESANALGSSSMSNSLMLAKQPGHPFWPFLIKRISKVHGAGRGLTRLTKIMTSTGPEQMSRSFSSYKSKKLPRYETVQALKKEYFNPCSICARGNKCAKGSNVLALHLNAGGWHSLTAKVYNHFYCNRVFYYIAIPILILLLVVIAVVVVRLKRCRMGRMGKDPKGKGACKPCELKKFQS